jgi:hypothetical protein
MGMSEADRVTASSEFAVVMSLTAEPWLIGTEYPWYESLAAATLSDFQLEQNLVVDALEAYIYVSAGKSRLLRNALIASAKVVD